MVVFGVGSLGALLLLGLAVLLQKCKFLQRPRNIVLAFNATRLAFLKLTGKKLVAAWLILIAILLLVTLATAVMDRNPGVVVLKPGQQAEPEPGKVIRNQENPSKEASDSGSEQSVTTPFQTGEFAPGKEQGVCGNGVCEPDLGESKEDCPRDCSPL